MEFHGQPHEDHRRTVWDSAGPFRSCSSLPTYRETARAQYANRGGTWVEWRILNAVVDKRLKDRVIDPGMLFAETRSIRLVVSLQRRGGNNI